MLRTSVVEEDIRFIMAACHDEFQALSGRTLLLTGASGFVGSYLVESIIAFNLSGAGLPCRLLLPTRSLEATRARWPHFFGHDAVVWFEWDGRTLCPPEDVCDYVIHAASPADPASYMHAPMQAMEDITHGTSAVLRYARHANVQRMLYLSSGAAYGKQGLEMEVLREDHPGAPDLNDPASCYGEAKRYSELLCRTSGIPVVIARLFAFVGPYQDLNGGFAAPDIIRQALYDNAIRLNSDGSAMRTYCYASDLAISLWKLLLRGRQGELYNVGAGSPQVSIRELAERIAGIVGGVEVRIKDGGAAGTRSRYIPDIGKAGRLYEPQIDLDQALRRTIQSCQQHMAIQHESI